VVRGVGRTRRGGISSRRDPDLPRPHLTRREVHQASDAASRCPTDACRWGSTTRRLWRPSRAGQRDYDDAPGRRTVLLALRAQPEERVGHAREVAALARQHFADADSDTAPGSCAASRAGHGHGRREGRRRYGSRARSCTTRCSSGSPTGWHLRYAAVEDSHSRESNGRPSPWHTGHLRRLDALPLSRMAFTDDASKKPHLTQGAALAGACAQAT